MRSLALFLIGALAFALGVELLCRVLPVSTSTATGYYFDPEILSYPAHHEWRVATGWDLRNAQTLHSNNVGFAAHRDFLPSSNPVVLVGDSYVEASMLAAADRPAARLEALIGGTRPVYAMGSPGTSLLDYAERIRWAAQRFGARDFVLLIEGGDLKQSVCGSGAVNSPCLDSATLAPRRERLPAPSAFKQALRNSAFAQYLVSQIRLDPGALLGKLFRARAAAGAGAARPAEGPGRHSIASAAASEFFKRVGQFAPDARLTFLVDGRHVGLDKPLPPADDAEREWFMHMVAQHGAHVVDAEKVYGAHYLKSQRSLNVGPYDPHLNAVGVDLLMRAAAEQLR